MNTGTAPNRPPAFDSTWRVRVKFPRADAPYLGAPWGFSDDTSIANLVGFLKRRDSLWRPIQERPNTPVLGPVVSADLDAPAGRVAILIYRAPTELGLEAKYASLYQTLTPAAADTLARLLRSPIRVVPVPPRDADAGPPRSRRTATAPQN